MSPRQRKRLSWLVIVVGLPVAAHLARALFDSLVLLSGWYILPFTATLLASRLLGLGGGLASALVAIVLASIDPPLESVGPTWYSFWPPLPNRVVALEMLTVVAGAALGSVIGRVRDPSRPLLAALDQAQTRRRRAERETHELATLAATLARPASPRQIADLVARVSRETSGADAALLLVAGESGPTAGPTLGPAAAESDELAAFGAAELLGACRATARTIAGTPDVRGPLLVPATVGAWEGDGSGSDATGAPSTPAIRVVGLALDAGAERLGSLVLGFSAPRVIDQRTLDILTLAARFGGEALARARGAAVARVERVEAGEAAARVERLQAIARELGPAVDATTIARLVVDTATDTLGARVGLLYRRASDPDRLELLHARGYPPGLVRSEQTVALDAGLPAADVVRRRTGVVVSAAEWRTRYPGASDIPAIASLTTLLAEPVGDDPVRGVLVVGWGGDVAIEAGERRFISALASHAVAALARADLVDALRDRQRRLDATLEVASAGAWDLDLERDRLDLSAEFLRVRGRPDKDAEDGVAAYLALVVPEDRDAVRAAIDEASRTLGPFATEFRAIGPDGSTRWVRSEGWVSAEGPSRRRRLTGIDRDITPERRAEEERERLLETERDARALQEAFVGVMSHELRTPITTILAAAKLLLRGGRSEETVRELGLDINAEAERLHRLIDDLLVMSRLERGSLVPDREPVHLRRLLERVIASEGGRWPDNRFVLGGDPGGDVVAAEETYVEQVARNLLSNAAKYAGPGTTVTIEVDPAPDEVVVRVLDEGPGIAATEVDDLFQLFFRSATTAATAAGAGIGLFVCDRLVRAMHGRIWARPRPGRGSEFGFSLGRYRDEDDDEFEAFGDRAGEPLPDAAAATETERATAPVVGD
jgi:PAS domain S-box-containing protein